MYVLVKEDWTNVGGPMHRQSTPTIFRKYFRIKTNAKKYALEDNGGYPIHWNNDHSGDLGSHAYYIKELQIED